MVLQSRVRFTHIYFSDSLKMMSATKINVTSKRLKIAKLRLQILVDNSKSYSKHTYFFKIKEKMTKLSCSKVGSSLSSKIVIGEQMRNDPLSKNSYQSKIMNR